ncbi:MAG: L,D-transpeptidase family protein [Streptosporangiaceae bacterium]
MRSTVLLCTAALAVSGCAGNTATGTASSPPPAQTEAIPDPAARRSSLNGLPESTTFTKLNGLPTDSKQYKSLTGTVVRPLRAKALHTRPEGPTVAVLPTTQLGGPTWVPVLETVPGWQRVLLPSKPNHSTAWLSDEGLETAHTPYAVRVRTGKRRLTLYKSGEPVGTWPVAVGADGTPTPPGWTFVLASMSQKAPSRTGPVVLPVGAHSATLDTFGGGPGTVAFHGWPDQKVFGKAASHGCVRVPEAALKALTLVPLGSPVLITS